MEHRDAVILQKVLSEINIAQDMVGDKSLAEFISSEMLKRAVCMTVINIGELVKNLSDDCRQDHCDPLESNRRILGYCGP